MAFRRPGPRDTTSLLFKLLAAASLLFAVFGLVDQNGTAFVAGLLAAVVFLAADAGIWSEHWPGKQPPEEVIEEREAPRVSYSADHWPESPPPTVEDRRSNPSNDR